MTKSELHSMIKEVLKEELNIDKTLKESRSIADIEAEIARLTQELEQAKIDEKRAALADKFPKFVYAWDMYLNPIDKGNWTSIAGEVVFETEDDAVNAGYDHLRELDHEDELGDDDEYVEPDDYTIDVIKIKLSSVPAYILEESGLEHLIVEGVEPIKRRCPRCGNIFYIAQEDWDINKFNCWCCNAALHHK
jgi:ribosomal protein S27AE